MLPKAVPPSQPMVTISDETQPLYDGQINYGAVALDKDDPIGAPGFKDFDREEVTRALEDGTSMKAPPLQQRRSMSFAFVLMWQVGWFLTAACLFTFFFYGFKTFLYLLLLGSILFAVYSFAKGSPQTKCLAGLFIVAVLCGTVVGRFDYALYTKFYYEATQDSLYNHVDPAFNAGGFVDAGMVHFAQGVYADSTNGVGLRREYDYCVAPLVNSKMKQDGEPIQFWAVGMNCCDARGAFHCDDAGVRDPDGFPVARYGIPVRDYEGVLGMLVKSRRDQYLDAVVEASGVYGLETNSHPMLVRFVERVDEFLNEMLASALLLLLWSSMLYVLLALVIGVAAMNVVQAEEKAQYRQFFQMQRKAAERRRAVQG